MNGMKKHVFAVLSLVCIVALMSGCVGGKSGQGSAQNAKPDTTHATTPSGVEKLELASVEEMLVGAPLTTKFENIIIGNFLSSSQVQTDYPEAAEDCEKQMLVQLKSKKAYKNVADDRAKKFSGKTAVVDLEIVDMRIASGTARMWGGVFAGSSFMDVMVKIRSAGSDDIIHQQLLSTSNNAWAASYSGGSSDRSLPADFGILIGEYLSKIIPAK